MKDDLLTPEEALYIGSTMLGEDIDPRLPKRLKMAGVSKEAIEEVNRERQEIGEISGFMTSVLFGIENPSKNKAFIGLVPLDLDIGQTIGEPKLVGILREGKMDRDVSRYSMTDEGRREIERQLGLLTVKSGEMKG